jgi:UDP-N-acetyl-D-glucosamine dehydrogenase
MDKNTNAQNSISSTGKTYKIPSKQELDRNYNLIKKRVRDFVKKTKKKIVVIQGLGFVGSAMAAVVADATDPDGKPMYFVIGVDLATTDTYWKIAAINEEVCPIVSEDEKLVKVILNCVKTKENLVATASEEVYELADIIVVDVNLDVKSRIFTDLENIEVPIEKFKKAIETIGRNMKEEALVLVESTVPPGTCKKIIEPTLSKIREARGIRRPVRIAYSYERVMPGKNYFDSIKNFWRTYAGIDNESEEMAKAFLATIINVKEYPLFCLNDTTAAELAKVLENSYRAVNIALIYEWTLLCERLGLNLFEIVESIRVRKGTHDNIKDPGFGVGGYCLPKDSFLAQWSASNLFSTDILLNMTMDAMNINYSMPKHTFELLKGALDNNIRGKKILICGISYLQDVADTRNSPTGMFVDLILENKGMPIVNDPFIKYWQERPKIKKLSDIFSAIKDVDAIVFALPHSFYLKLDIHELIKELKHPVVVIDAQNIISDDKAIELHKAGCKVKGVGKGHWNILFDTH